MMRKKIAVSTATNATRPSSTHSMTRSSYTDAQRATDPRDELIIHHSRAALSFAFAAFAFAIGIQENP